jgi:hypothetical protein
MCCPDSAADALAAKFKLDGAPGTVSSSRSWRLGRASAAGFGRDDVARAPSRAGRFAETGLRGVGAALRAGFFAARDTARRAEALELRRRGRAVFRAWALRAGFAAFRREAVLRAEALRVAFFGLLRPAFRLPAFAFRFAITGPFSSLTVYP